MIEVPDFNNGINKLFWPNQWLFHLRYIEFDIWHSYVAWQFTNIDLIIHMCNFLDITDAPDSCDEKVGFFIVGSSCPIYSGLKTV